MVFLTAAVCVLGTLVVVLLLINAFLFKELLTMRLTFVQISSLLGTMVGRQQAQEMYLRKLGDSFTEFTNMVGNTFEKLSNGFGTFSSKEFRTMDGKYSASSLEELISKIKDDGTEDKYLSNDELDNLRKMFDDEDDDDTFNPKKGKF